MLLTAESFALLVMQPAKLLQDLCMVGVSVKNPPVRRLCGIILDTSLANNHTSPRATRLRLFAARVRGQSETRYPLR